MLSGNRLSFEVEAVAAESAARACRLITLHGEIRTPVFMPVATFAALRNQHTEAVGAIGFPVLLANTYHLLLRPGVEVFRHLGGIHRFMNWKRAVLTDSGGFQVFSLAKSCRIEEEGARFRSYMDGREILLSPEKSIQTQQAIGADILMAMDHCVPSKSEESLCRRAVEITARWAERSLTAHGEAPQALFGIVQGACVPKLRRLSAEQITSLPFDGFAIGGLAVGETAEERKNVTEMTAALLPRLAPRYLMGVGAPIDLLEGVKRGIDMFDCIIPTALGQQGVAFTSAGRLQLRRSAYKFADRPLDAACECMACSGYSRAYLHHLIKCDQFLGSSLVGLHNLFFYHRLMEEMRRRILAGTFDNYYRAQKEVLQAVDDEHPAQSPLPKRRPCRRELGAYEIVRQAGSFHSIRHKASGEIMHSVSDPTVEAMTLYVRQSGIMAASEKRRTDPWVIWDVGLGAGANAMATLSVMEELCRAAVPPAELRLISFEKDLDALRLACRHAALFPYLRHTAPTSLLRHGNWQSERVPAQWFLREGDFLKTLDTVESPDCIYYDPFSLYTDTQMWKLSTFERIFRRSKASGTTLITYSASTQVRSALLAAGFSVGPGVGSGPKAETTLAFSRSGSGAQENRLLKRDWLVRFEKSTAKADASCSAEEAAEISRRVRKHPQFQ